ncbi:anthranilate synthase component I [Thermocladium modestius]|uniref:anthranilate synthase n=1 Tax=Thermocladium modestius TaxID=62609 RepID=A0A830GSL7_9CREN|nr:chorismate-binding protein [Thermocladium modestius]GGP18886.1 anthranilate synthase component I [Thermocladium modestius]
MKVPLNELPPPRELADKLVDAGEDPVMLLEGSGEKSRFSVVAWGMDDRLEATDSLYDDLKRMVRRLGGLEDGRIAIGYLSYEAVLLMEDYARSFMKPLPGWPLGEFVVPSNVVVYDNALRRAYVNAKLEDLGHGDHSLRLGEMVRGTRREDYERWVGEAIEDIRSGEAFQIVLSRFEEYGFSGNLFPLYSALADLNPSPYMFYLRMGPRVLLGSSPEMLIEVDGGRAVTKPIAGTRPRGLDPREDLRLEEDLLSSEKELAEHTMLVDLARNDLGRVCRFGTVRVREMYSVEKYESVQHIVSTVEGVLERGSDVVDALFATFPAGTVSGAPKPRAMELIAKYEGEPRGPYAGAVGFLHGNGGEFAITIRSLFASGGVARLQAGAGVVFDSVPRLEYEETEHKLGSLRRVMKSWT